MQLVISFARCYGPLAMTKYGLASLSPPMLTLPFNVLTGDNAKGLSLWWGDRDYQLPMWSME